jgi:hypothetical protein
MKLVTLTKDLRPWRKNDRVPVPDALADKLVAEGDAVNPEPFTAAHARPGAEVNSKPRPSLPERAVRRVRETLRLTPKPAEPSAPIKTRGIT